MNPQNKKQIIIAGALGVVLIVVLGYQLFVAGGIAGRSSAPAEDARQGQGARERRAERERQAASPVLQRVDVDIEQLIATVEVEPIDYNKARIPRNPMSPLVGQITPMAGLEGEGEGDAVEVATPAVLDTIASKRITSIVWNPRKAVAIVDDEMVYAGYVYPDGVEVIAVEPTRVLFKAGSAVVPVEMKEP